MFLFYEVIIRIVWYVYGTPLSDYTRLLCRACTASFCSHQVYGPQNRRCLFCGYRISLRIQYAQQVYHQCMFHKCVIVVFFCGALPPAFNCPFHKFLCIVVLVLVFLFWYNRPSILKYSANKSVGSSGMFGFVTSRLSSLARSVVFSFYSVAPCHAYGGLCILRIPAGCRLYAHRLSPAVITPNYGVSRRVSFTL